MSIIETRGRYEDAIIERFEAAIKRDPAAYEDPTETVYQITRREILEVMDEFIADHNKRFSTAYLQGLKAGRMKGYIEAQDAVLDAPNNPISAIDELIANAED